MCHTREKKKIEGTKGRTPAALGTSLSSKAKCAPYMLKDETPKVKSGGCVKVSGPNPTKVLFIPPTSRVRRTCSCSPWM